MIPKYRMWNSIISKLCHVTGLYFDSKAVQYIDEVGKLRLIKFENTILMQSTGLFDKNGKEIFEKDIVDYKGRKAIIKWHGSYASFIYEFVDELQNRTTEWQPLYLSYYYFEIIGNSFENPELLEVTE